MRLRVTSKPTIDSASIERMSSVWVSMQHLLCACWMAMRKEPMSQVGSLSICLLIEPGMSGLGQTETFARGASHVWSLG